MQTAVAMSSRSHEQNQALYSRHYSLFLQQQERDLKGKPFNKIDQPKTAQKLLAFAATHPASSHETKEKARCNLDTLPETLITVPTLE